MQILYFDKLKMYGLCLKVLTIKIEELTMTYFKTKPQ